MSIEENEENLKLTKNELSILQFSHQTNYDKYCKPLNANIKRLKEKTGRLIREIEFEKKHGHPCCEHKSFLESKKR